MEIVRNPKLAKLKPKTFILNHLIPFILRDAGRGFVMEKWKMFVPQDGKLYLDGVLRQGPVCNTAACIGGSIQILTGIRDREEAGKLLGISELDAEKLFFGWRPEDNGWPKKFAERFAAAKTAYGKARVACALLRQIALKGSKVLEND